MNEKLLSNLDTLKNNALKVYGIDILDLNLVEFENFKEKFKEQRKLKGLGEVEDKSIEKECRNLFNRINNIRSEYLVRYELLFVEERVKVNLFGAVDLMNSVKKDINNLSDRKLKSELSKSYEEKEKSIASSLKEYYENLKKTEMLPMPSGHLDLRSEGGKPYRMFFKNIIEMQFALSNPKSLKGIGLNAYKADFERKISQALPIMDNFRGVYPIFDRFVDAKRNLKMAKTRESKESSQGYMNMLLAQHKYFILERYVEDNINFLSDDMRRTFDSIQSERSELNNDIQEKNLENTHKFKNFITKLYRMKGFILSKRNEQMGVHSDKVKIASSGAIGKSKL